MINDIERAKLFKYFKPYYIIDNNCEEGFYIKYFIKYNEYLVFESDVFYNLIANKHSSKTSYNSLLNKAKPLELIHAIQSELKNSFEGDFQKAKDKFYEKEREKIIEQFKNEISEFSTNSLKEDSHKLLKNKLVNLEYHLNFAYDEIELSLKVGIDKFYVVSNIEKFISLIARKEDYTYGKNLTFNHSIDNFHPRERKFIELLYLFANYNVTNKAILLNYKKINLVMDILKNRKIYVNEKLMLVRLDKFPGKIFIDKDYILHTTFAKNSVLFEGLQNTVYIFDFDNGVIDYVDKDSCNIGLISLLKKYDGFDIKPILNEFKKDIYSAYQEDISIDESITKDFKVDVIKIEAYFDYVDGIIEVKPRFLKNNQEIDLKSAYSNFADKNRIEKFNYMLKEMSFEDNVLKDSDAIYAFFTTDFTPLKRICDVYLSESILSKQVIQFKPPVIRVKYENNLLSFLLEESNYSNEELYKILKAIRSKRKYFILNKDTIIDLTDNENNNFNNLVTDLKLNEKELKKEVVKPLYQSFKLQNYPNNVSLDSHVEEIINNLANFKNANFDIPKLNAELRQYQKEGFYWLKILSNYNLGGILADDMGLGKTLEMIALLKSDEKEMPSLIVCPKSLIFNWHSEFAKFDPDAKVIEIYGGVNERKNIINKIDYNKKIIYITSYDSLRNDDYNKDKAFNYLIIDEGQYIKNIKAKKTQSVKELKAIHKFALTGTPIENNTLDLWSLFDYIMPDYLQELSVFKTSSNDENFLMNLSKKIAPFILRRTKKEVLKDLPNKYERIVTADLSEEQLKIYDAYVLKAKDTFNNSDNAMIAILSIITRLRQICVDPRTFIDNYYGTSGKIEILKNLLDEYIANNHKILIFSQFVSALEILEKELKTKNISYYKLTGDTSAKERVELANKFNNNDIPVFLISLKAGGTGLNLIGADTIIHLDPWWNVSAENQATDRSHRIGQTKNVEVIKLICRNTIEQRVIELQNIKKDLIDKLISDNDSSITKLSKDDLAYILS